MPAWRNYRGQSIGLARIMADVPYSDGKTAQLIRNFVLDERGRLDSTYRIMELIPPQLNGGLPPFAFQVNKYWTRKRSGVFAMCHTLMYGEHPEIIFLTRRGVMRYTPWNRPNLDPSLFFGPLTIEYGLEEQYYYTRDNNKKSIRPQQNPFFPPQIIAYGNRMYFSFCDGGGLWVWDGEKVRPFGYSMQASPPLATGPERSGTLDTEANSGGFSHRGRIGTTESSFQTSNITGGLVAGGVDNSIYRYAVLFENTDGAYSMKSTDGPKVSIEFEVAAVGKPVERLQKRFRLHDIPVGPPGTVARILLRTYNLLRLPSGSEWKDRAPVPIGCYLLQTFSGSLFLLRNEAYPYRVWWSEQDTAGPIPESFMSTHWMDIFPSTGPITGSIIGNLADTRKQFLIVYKESSSHYITGDYPHWQTGTLHAQAGLAGPNLVQTLPDGTILWYGSGTFWMLENGSVVDIGKGIRRRLSKVNESRSRYGVSWVDRQYREGVFVLPTEDNVQPNMQFIWDYKNRGWRIREDIHIDCALTLPKERCTLLGGITTVTRPAGTCASVFLDSNGVVQQVNKYQDERDVEVASVFVYHRSYPSYGMQERTSTYQSGWLSFSGLGPKLHSSDRATQIVITGQERSNGIATVESFKDWNFDSSEHTPVEISCASPEDDTISFFGSSVYNSTNMYRNERVYTEKVAIDIDTHSVHSIKIETKNPMSLYNIDIYGPNVSGPGSRTSTNDP